MGISLGEACARGAMEQESLDELCNPDGTIKKQGETTTFSIKDSDISYTVSNTFLYIVFSLALVILLFLAFIAVKFLVRKARNKK